MDSSHLLRAVFVRARQPPCTDRGLSAYRLAEVLSPFIAFSREYTTEYGTGPTIFRQIFMKEV